VVLDDRRGRLHQGKLPHFQHGKNGKEAGPEGGSDLHEDEADGTDQAI
jgi:hypothetical protein